VKSVNGGCVVPKCHHDAFKPARVLLEAKSIIIALCCQLFRSAFYALRLVNDVKPCLLTIPNNLRKGVAELSKEERDTLMKGFLRSRDYNTNKHRAQGIVKCFTQGPFENVFCSRLHGNQLEGERHHLVSQAPYLRNAYGKLNRTHGHCTHSRLAEGLSSDQSRIRRICQHSEAHRYRIYIDFRRSNSVKRRHHPC
jgi:hypothetical protein